MPENEAYLLVLFRTFFSSEVTTGIVDDSSLHSVRVSMPAPKSETSPDDGMGRMVDVEHTVNMSTNGRPFLVRN